MNRFKQAELSTREYRQRHSKLYKAVFKYALDNWNELSKRANYQLYGKEVVSIADQLQAYTDCPYGVASEIAQSVSISMIID